MLHFCTSQFSSAGILFSFWAWLCSSLHKQLQPQYVERSGDFTSSLLLNEKLFSVFLDQCLLFVLLWVSHPSKSVRQRRQQEREGKKKRKKERKTQFLLCACLRITFLCVSEVQMYCVSAKKNWFNSWGSIWKSVSSPNTVSKICEINVTKNFWSTPDLKQI